MGPGQGTWLVPENLGFLYEAVKGQLFDIIESEDILFPLFY